MHPLKNSVKFLWYSLRDLFIPVTKSEFKADSIVIVKVDAIGDYILFRNFLEEIATSRKYSSYELTLVGNEIWKPIAEKLDAKWVDTFIWVNPKKFQKEFSYRKEKVKELRKYKYSLLFHPTFSRDYYIAESITSFINAKEKISVQGDEINLSSWQKKKSDKQYSTLIQNPTGIHFEYSKNKELLSEFLDENLDTKYSISLNESQLTRKIEEEYVILFIGGSADFKKWSTKNWEELIDKILSTFPYTIVLAGGPDDLANGQEIKKNFVKEDRLINLCAQTSLLELISLISYAEWMVSNETSAPHIAAALGVPVLVLSNANHYARFLPYPSVIFDKHYSIFSEEVENEKNEDLVIQKYGEGSDLSIQSIYVEDVFDQIVKNFS